MAISAPMKRLGMLLCSRQMLAMAAGPVATLALLWLLPEQQLKVHLVIDLRAMVLLLAAACGCWVWLHESKDSMREKPNTKPVSSPDDSAKWKAVEALQEQMMLALAEMKAQKIIDDQDAQARQSAEDTERSICQLYKELEGASGVLVHRFRASAIETGEETWSSPLFTACNRLWSIRIGRHSPAATSLYFCIIPHDHKDRLRCWFLFARAPGKGYKEWRVHDWPPELAGHPWGPSVPLEEIEDYKQADGSILLLVHAAGLQAVVGEIHFQNWSKELKNFMADKKTDDFLIRDRHGNNIAWLNSTIEPPAADLFPLVVLQRQE